jgi:thiamine-monophosphate kinase
LSSVRINAKRGGRGRSPRKVQSEDDFVSWLQRHQVPVGNDTAHLHARDLAGGLAITTDSQIEGIHFPAGTDPWLIAQRLLRVNLSDLAAAGARPRWILCNLNAPSRFDRQRFMRGLLADCLNFSVQLIGGDTSSCSSTACSLTALGDLPPGHQTLGRDAGKPGHLLWVSGTLGEAGLGLRLQQAGARFERARVHLPRGLPRSLEVPARKAVRRHRLPEPHTKAGLELSALAARTTPRKRPSAIDLSDGLLRDALRLSTASHCAIEIEIDHLPLPSRAPALAAFLEVDPTHLALSGGEDYVLLFTLPPGLVPPSGSTCIGRLSEEAPSPLRLVQDGRDVTQEILAALPALGWDHLAPED